MESGRDRNSFESIEQYYRKTVAAIDEIVYAVKTDGDPLAGQLQLVGDRVREIIGYEPEEFLQDENLWFRIIHPDDRATVALASQELVLRKTTITRIYRIQHKLTGEYRWVEDKPTPQFDEDGRLIGIFGVARDITGRRLIEESLRQSEERFHSQFKSNPVPSYMWKQEGGDFVLLDYNAAAEAISERRVRDLVGVRAKVLYEDRPDIVERLFRCSDERRALEQETRYRFKTTGKEKIFSVSYVFLPPDLVVMYTHDITERKQAQGELQKALDELDVKVQERTAELVAANATLSTLEAKFRGLLESAPDAIVGVEKDGQIALVNRQTELLFGYERGELLGARVEVLLPVRFDEAHQANRARYVAKPETRRMGAGQDQVARRKDGSEFAVEITLSALETEGGLLSICIIRDITERKQAEEKINAALKEKNILLQEIHHRVKNNLQIVSSLLDLQASHVWDARDEQMFRESQCRVRSIALLHEKLYQSEDLASIDFSAYVRDLAQKLMISYKTGVSDVHVHVRIEQVRLSLDSAIPCGLIMNELVSNSLKHAFRPSAKRAQVENEIDILLRRWQDGGLELVVSDNGIGGSPSWPPIGKESVGLHLVNILARQLCAEVEVRTENGTQFAIRFRER